MRLIVVFVLAVSVSMGFLGCQKPSEKVSGPGATAVVQPPLSKEDLERQKRLELLDSKKWALNNTEWDVQMTPLSGKGEPMADTIIFSDYKIAVKSLQAKGFGPSNYTLTLQDNDTRMVWDTMQRGKEEIVFIRGEVSMGMDSLSGVISFQKSEGSQAYSYRSTAKRKLFVSE